MIGEIRVFRTRTFTRWMRRYCLSDDVLCGAVSEIVAGLIDADLGGGILKKRIAVSGQGKRGSARVIVATKLADRWFFLFGFAKNQKGNIDDAERRALQEYGKLLLGLNELELQEASQRGEITEICNGQS